MNQYLSSLGTETINEATKNIDMCSTLEMVTLMNSQDMDVPRAVEAELINIAKAVDIIHKSLSNKGRMIYLGAGTSGRLGVLDASECPPTFSTPANMVQGFIAGGDSALRNPAEGCEDSAELGINTILDAKITDADVVVGITASGSAPYVLAAIDKANQIGAATIGVVTNANTKLAKICDVCIAPVVGPEVITGSTRLKSGTAQKLVLNMLTTCSMVKLGKVYGNLMVDLCPTNIKLQDRARRIICEITKVDEQTAAKTLIQADNNTKLAIMMINTGLNREESLQILNENDGILRKAFAAAEK